MSTKSSRSKETIAFTLMALALASAGACGYSAAAAPTHQRVTVGDTARQPAQDSGDRGDVDLAFG